jgi:ribosomal protein S10
MSDLIEPQPQAIPNDTVSIWKLVIADMEKREQFGLRKHKTYLQIDDGRDHLIDAYQEALDLAVYLRQEIEQRRVDHERDQHHKADRPVPAR